MMKGMAVMLVVLVLAAGQGCAQKVKKVPFQINAPFDEATASEAMKPGENTITGGACVYIAGGGFVTCAEKKVILLPYTEYTAARMSAIFGSSERGFLHAINIPNYSFTPNPAGYKKYRSATLCNAQGNFRFDNLNDGTYYLFSSILWVAKSMKITGGWLMQKVSVQGGREKRVFLSQ